MKLIDILARELVSWPDNVFSITQDDGGALNGNSAEDPPVLKCTAWGGGAFYLDNPLNTDECFKLEQAEDYSTAIVSHAQWQAAVDALKAIDKVVVAECVSAVKPWNGEGQPPAGTECEFSDWKKEDWKRGIVRYMSAITAVIEIGDNHEQIAHPTTLRYRQIRTPEQIAAEARKSAVEKMMSETDFKCSVAWAKNICADLYDAGYRKFEITEE